MKLKVKQMTYRVRGKTIFDQADMKIDAPGVYGLVAPNGYGKTTLLNLLTGLLNPQSGQIDLLDHPKTHQLIFDKVAYLQDNSVLYPYLTGQQHLDFLMQIHHLDQADVEATAKRLKAADFLSKRVSSYSLGMKQRLLLVMALIVKPTLLLLDEPLNGLDPTTLRIVREVILDLEAKQQVTVLISSHNLDELMKVTHHYFFITGQRIDEEVLGAHDSPEARYRTLFEEDV